MGQAAIVAGTGFDDRAKIIRLFCKTGRKVLLEREPNNSHDPNAIAVYLKIPVLWGLLGTAEKKIGYIKSRAASSLAKKMDEGLSVNATVSSFYAPPDLEFPRVSLNIEY